ncbi:MAG: hypothetical protein WBP93_19240 [Pyrinomonadaceae bacterium]
MMRSILSIIAGFILICVLAFGADAVVRAVMPGLSISTGRVDSVPVLLFVIAYVFVFAVFGCYITARLAPHSPMKHALILGLLGLVFNIVGAIMMWHTAPAWFHIVSLILVMPAAWLGGRLREAQLRQMQLA